MIDLADFASNFDSRPLRLRDITSFVSQMPLLHYPFLSFTQNLEMFP